MSSDVDEVWAYTPLRPGLLHRRRSPRRPGPCRAPGGGSATVPRRCDAVPARDREAVPIPVRRGDDPPQGDRRPARGVRRGLHRDGPGLPGDQGPGGHLVLSRTDGRGADRAIRIAAGRPGDRVPRPGSGRRRAGRPLHGLRLPGASLSRRGLRPADRRGDGERAARRSSPATAPPWTTATRRTPTSSPRGSSGSARSGSAIWRRSTIPGWPSPTAAALRDVLRDVVDRPDEARAKGRAAAAHVRAHLTWDQAVDVLEARLGELARRPIRRFERRGARGRCTRSGARSRPLRGVVDRPAAGLACA